METEYIKRADVLERNDLTWYDLDTFIVHTDLVRDKNEEMIYSIPPANVIELRKGTWIDVNDNPLDVRMKCSVCGVIDTPLARWNFCPNCGADMRKSDND